MNIVLRHSAIICSTAALMALGTAGVAGAQSKSYGQGACPPGQEDCPQDMRRSSDDVDEGMTRKRRVKVEDAQADVTTEGSRRMSQTEWRFDPNRHERRRKKDTRFRHHWKGYWYEEPFWRFGLVINPRIGCREGQDIVRDRGFRRVRIVECAGRTYTYLGRRHGDRFRVFLSARTGRIVDVDPI